MKGEPLHLYDICLNLFGQLQMSSLSVIKKPSYRFPMPNIKGSQNSNMNAECQNVRKYHFSRPPTLSNFGTYSRNVKLERSGSSCFDVVSLPDGVWATIEYQYAGYKQ